MKDNGTYCKYFWTHSTLWNGQSVIPCCRYDVYSVNANGNPGLLSEERYPFTSFKDALNSNTWEIFRDNSLNGVKDGGCYRCYEDEENGITSLRQRANTLNWSNDTEVKLTFLEINLGNYCNLACTICGSASSSLWYEDDVAIDKLDTTFKYRRGVHEPDKNVIPDFNISDFEDVRYIKFVGGEPMIHPKFIKLLDLLIDNKFNERIELQIFTNSSWMPKEKVTSRLAKFSNVNISLSIDGIGAVNDYSRYPSKWDVVHNSAKEWLSIANDNSDIHVCWEPTISIYNANHIPEMFGWWIDTCQNVTSLSFEKAMYHKNFDDININLNSVYYPNYLQPGIFTDSINESKKIDRFMEKLIFKYSTNDPDNRLMLRKVQERLEESKNIISRKVEPEQLDMFWSWTKDIESVRKNSLQKELPKLYKSLKS